MFSAEWLVSITFTQGIGLMAAKYSAACRTSSSEVAFAIGPMRASSFRDSAFEIVHLAHDVLGGEAGDVGGFGMPLSRHEVAGCRMPSSPLPVHLSRFGARGRVRRETSRADSRCLRLSRRRTLWCCPAQWTGPVGSTLGGCTLSGMLYAHEGSPLGIDCGTCA